MKKYIYILMSCLAALACFARPASAQYLGTVSPQTVQATLANNAPCTGTEQDFTTGAIPNFRNLGLTQHIVTSTNGGLVTQFTMVIQGIDNQGNVSNISDIGQLNGSINASGYFPNIRVAVTCLPATTGVFSLSYSGGSATTPVVAGSFLSSQIDKLIFRGSSASANQTTATMATPFGSSAGKLLFQYVTGSTAGSSITIFCSGSVTVGSYDNLQFSLANNNTNVQVFTVPATQCPNYQVNYTSGGAAGTIEVEYLFDQPGILPSATQLNGCQSLVLTSTLPITVGASTTASIVPPFTGHQIAVCSLTLSVGVAGTVQLIEGTGATCGTGPSNLSGAMSLVVGTPLALGASAPIFSTNSVSDRLCLTTAGGATAAGMISFIYTPI